MIEIGLAALTAVLVLLVEHWFPWQLLLRRRLPRLAAYTLGVLGLLAPLTCLYGWWLVQGQAPAPWAHLVGLWAVVIGGGLAVQTAHVIDWLFVQLARSRELQELFEARDERKHQSAGEDPTGSC